MKALAVAIARIEQSSDFDEITGLCRTAAARFGYDMFVVYAIEPDAELAEDAIYWLEGHWFGSGQPLDARKYLRRCPMNRHVLHTDQPFFWSKRRGADEDEYRVVSNPQGPGPHGLQVPVFGPEGLQGAVSFGGKAISATTEAQLTLAALANALFRALRRLAGNTSLMAFPQLTAREREILSWIAAGQRQGDVASLLGLSERTVENHLRRVRKRLGVASTAQAVYRFARTSNEAG